jgi:hypothetical protein
METFFWSLLLAATSAITYVAYKHPRSFRINVAPPIFAVTILCVVGITSWTLAGANVAIDNLTDEISKLEGDKTFLEHAANDLKEAYTL